LICLGFKLRASLLPCEVAIFQLFFTETKSAFEKQINRSKFHVLFVTLSFLAIIILQVYLSPICLHITFLSRLDSIPYSVISKINPSLLNAMYQDGFDKHNFSFDEEILF